MQKIIKYAIIIHYIIICNVAFAARSLLEFPLSEDSHQTILLKIDIPNHYVLLPDSHSGFIPGVLTFITDDNLNLTHYYYYKGIFKVKWPSVIGLYQSKLSMDSQNLVNKRKAKVQKEFFVSPILIQEQSEIIQNYTMHAVGFIIGYSGRADVDIVYLRYFSGNKNTYGLELVRTLPPTKQGVSVSITQAKEELKVLTKFADKISNIKIKSQ